MSKTLTTSRETKEFLKTLGFKEEHFKVPAEEEEDLFFVCKVENKEERDKIFENMKKSEDLSFDNHYSDGRCSFYHKAGERVFDVGCDGTVYVL